MMMLNVRPLSWLFRFLTFSSTKIAGRRAAIILTTSKNSVPCVSQAKPWARPRAFFFDTPAREKGWQGKPASSTSC
ncbi:Uncharacterised protein [Raoultella terrigena]|uniref:Uncharacterized protein n=1 Tax=Raoultella terrigena TaxID=577 RepID=A0A3P8KVV7_RAOTE|nr:Uncharacterised protein [Raoultella terrigena]